MAACALLAVTSCAPPVAAPQSDGQLETPVRDDSLFLSASHTNPGTGEWIRDLLPGATGPEAPLVVETDSQDGFEELLAWQYPLGPGDAGPIFEISVETADVHDALFRWRIHRLDECGRLMASSSSTRTQTLAGSHRARLRLDTEWQAGDSLRLTLEGRARSGSSRGRVEVMLGEESVVKTSASAADRALAAGQAEQASTPAGVSGLANTWAGGQPVDGTGSGSDAQGRGWNNQRNIWWNTAASRWDGILPVPSVEDAGVTSQWLWTDLSGHPSAEQEISQRTRKTPDAYWDDACGQLYVFMSRGASGTSRFSRYAYDAHSGSYSQQTPNGGVEAPVTLRGTYRVSITKSPKGHLWAAVNHDHALLVSRSIDGGDTWAPPSRLAETGADGDTHWVVFEQAGSTRLGLAATEDGAAPGAKVRFLHIDQNEENWADPGRWVDETSWLPPPEGEESADDELSAISYRGSTYVVTETEPKGLTRQVGGPQLVLYHRTAAGDWSRHVIARYTGSGEADRKRPVVGVNHETGHLLVGVGRNDRRVAYLYRAPLDDLGSWEEHVLFETTDDRQALFNVQLSRFPVDETTGTLALIEEAGGGGRVWRQVVWSAGQVEASPGVPAG